MQEFRQQPCIASEKASENYKLRMDHHQLNPAAGPRVLDVYVTEFISKIHSWNSVFDYVKAYFSLILLDPEDKDQVTFT